MNVQIKESQIPMPKNPFKPTDAFPKEKAPTLAELSKSKPKPAYVPINFKPVPPQPIKPLEEWHKLGSKRKSPDGMDIHVYNKHLY